jgi:hypothetical protein
VPHSTTVRCHPAHASWDSPHAAAGRLGGWQVGHAVSASGRSGPWDDAPARPVVEAAQLTHSGGPGAHSPRGRCGRRSRAPQSPTCDPLHRHRH